MSEWIAVEDRLPEYGKQVLTYSEWNGWRVDYLKTSNLFTADHYDEGWPTTHWQPLPPPPEDKQ